MGNATMLASINNGPGVPATLEVETEQIDVSTFSKTKPDTHWEYVDPFGHFHAFDKDGKLPTLTPRTQNVDDCDDCDDCEGYTITVYECAICDAPVEPVWVTVPTFGREFMPGRTSWTVEVEQRVTESRVSVRLTAGDLMFFGIAAPGGSRSEGGRDGVRTWTTLNGVSPLGQRKARTPANA